VTSHGFIRTETSVILTQPRIASEAIPLLSMSVWFKWSTDQSLPNFSTKMIDDFAEVPQEIVAGFIRTDI